VINNPALGGGSSVKFDEASKLLGILGTLIGQGADGMDDLKKFTASIEDMAAKGRAPTAEEMGILDRRSDDAHARLQAAKEELLEETTPEEPEPAPEPEPEPTPEPTPEPDPEVVEEDPVPATEPDPVEEGPEDPQPPPTG
jgi:outer membrane biosynthesis protein TonB